MADFKPLLDKLHKNLNILREREAKYGGNAPIELRNQIDDHLTAIALTDQVMKGEISKEDWHEALKPLLVAIKERSGEAASSVTLGDIEGGIYSSQIAGRDITIINNYYYSEMDPKRSLITTALIVGANKVAKNVSVDLYDVLKFEIKKRFGNESQIAKAIDKLETDPESKRQQEALGKEVASTQGIEAPEIVEAATAFLDKTSSQPTPEEVAPTLKISAQETVRVQEIISVEKTGGTQPEPEEGAATEAEGLDVPRFDFFRKIPPTKSIHTTGIQFTDKDPQNRSDPPKLYLSVYFKETKYFVQYPLSTNEKWLYLEANMRPALNLRIQVSANMRDVDELMEFLRNGRDEWDLHGPRPADDQAGDYFYVWRENGENRLMISTFTPTNAGISIHARFSNQVAKAFADYLVAVGFTKPLE